MGQALEMLDCLVIGNEPTGIWLVNHLRELESRLPFQEKKPYVPLKLGHLALGTTGKTALPSSIAKRFAISLDETQSVEVVTPKKVFSWNESSLKSLFPELGPLLNEAPFCEQMSRQAGSAVRYTLRNNPEILGFASGIWKIFGRSVTLTPELLVWNTIQLGSYGYWQPAFSANTQVTPLQTAAPLKEIKADRNAVTLHFDGAAPVQARHCIINLSLEDLYRFKKEIGGLSDALPEEAIALQAHYPLTLSLAPSAIPSPMRPLVLYLDTEEIPDLKDIWYLQTNRDEGYIRLWVSERNESSLEAILEEMRRKLGALFHHLPYLEGSLNSIYPTLGVESCYGEIDRHETDKELGRLKEFRVTTTPIHSYLNTPKLRFFTPQLKCFFPHPYGPLSEASRFAVELLGRTTHRKAVRYQNALP